MPAFQPTESDLKRLGFRTNSPAQPFPTRTYHASLPNDNYLTLCPRPGMQTACEFTGAGKMVARHTIRSLYDLQESVEGRGKRQVV